MCARTTYQTGSNGSFYGNVTTVILPQDQNRSWKPVSWRIHRIVIVMSLTTYLTDIIKPDFHLQLCLSSYLPGIQGSIRSFRQPHSRRIETGWENFKIKFPTTNCPDYNATVLWDSLFLTGRYLGSSC